MKKTHVNSPLGHVMGRVAALEAVQAEAAERVAQRKTDLAEIWDDLASVSPDADVDEVAALILKEMATARLLEVAEEALVDVSRDLERVRGAKGDLERRLQRVEAALSSLEDDDAVVPYSPSERKAHAARARWQMAVISGDPEALDGLRATYEGGPPAVMAGKAFNLDRYAAEINRIAG